MKGTIILTTMLMLLIGNSIFAQSKTALITEKAKSEGSPKPILKFVSKELEQKNGVILYRLRFRVSNYQSYSNTLFSTAPELPPCGKNTNASRTWVSLFDAATHQRLYSFCAINSADELNQLWFPLIQGGEPHDCVYVEMIDRKLGKLYRSKKVCIPNGKPVGKADLNIRQFLFPPTSNKTLRVEIGNNGESATKACLLRLTVREIDGTAVGRTIEFGVPPLAAGKTAWVLINADRILPNNVALQNTIFKLNIDSTGTISESDESNNEAWHNL